MMFYPGFGPAYHALFLRERYRRRARRLAAVLIVAAAASFSLALMVGAGIL